MKWISDKHIDAQLIKLVKAGGLKVEVTGGNHIRVITNNGHREILPCTPRNPRSCIKSLRRIRDNVVKES